MKNLESKLQIFCVKLFRLKYPKLILFAIPNGGQRNLITASILKAEGTTSGVPDLFLAYPKGNFAGLFIEMKSEKGVVQPSQKEMMQKLSDAGYKCVICRTVDDFTNEIENYLK